jgi:hypothetical protein
MANLFVEARPGHIFGLLVGFLRRFYLCLHGTQLGIVSILGFLVLSLGRCDAEIDSGKLLLMVSARPYCNRLYFCFQSGRVL